MAELPRLGDRIAIPSKSLEGVVRFVGETEFAKGQWIGVELDAANGKNNGSVKGKQYFTCAENYGMFVKPNFTKIISRRSSAASSRRATPPAIQSPPPEPVAAPAAAAPPPAAAAVPTPVAAPAPTPAPVAATAAAPTPAPAAAAPAGRSPAAQIAILEGKLRMEMEKTRKALEAEDKAKLREANAKQLEARSKQHLEQMKGFKHKWIQQTEVKDKELEAMKRELAKAQTELAAKTKETASFGDSAMADDFEMATLDKEMAEEKLKEVSEEKAALDAENAELRDRVEELELTMEIVREEAGSGSPEAVRESKPFRELEAQNQKLTEALIRLRDFTEQLKAELEQTRDGGGNGHANNRKAGEAPSERLVAAEAELKALKEQLEVSASSEAIVERLTERNMALDAKNQEMAEELMDMQTLIDMSDEFEEAHAQVEKGLQEDIDGYERDLRERDQALELLSENLLDSQTVIEQYSLRLEEMRVQMAEPQDLQAPELAETQDRIKQAKQELAVLKQHQIAAAFKERHATLDKALLKLQAEQSREHIKLLKLFLPEAFFDEEYDGLRLHLAFLRIQAKAAIVLDHVTSEFRPTADLETLIEEDFTVEQVAFARDLTALLTAYRTESEYCSRVLSKCSIEVYHTVSGLCSEVVANENSLSTLINKCQREGLDPSVNLDELRLAVRHLRRLSATKLRAVYPMDAAEHLRTAMEVIGASANVASAKLHHMRNLVQQGNDETPELKALVSRISSWVTQSRNLRVTANKILKKLRDVTEVEEYDERTRNGVEAACADAFRMAQRLSEACRVFYDHVHSSVTLKTLSPDNAMTLATSHQIDITDTGSEVAKAVASQAEESMVPSYVKEVLSKAIGVVLPFDRLYPASLPLNLENGHSATPWETRAGESRKLLAASLGLEAELDKKSVEAKELKKALKLKDKELASQGAALSTANRRVDVVKGDLQKHSAALEAKNTQLEEELAAQAEKHKRTLDHLEGDLRDLEEQRDQLQLQTSSRGHGRVPRFVKAPIGVGSDEVPTESLIQAENKINTLRLALEHSRNELARVRAAQLKAKLSAMAGLQLRRPLEERKFSAKVSADVSGLLKDLQTTNSAPRIVNISARRDAIKGADVADCIKRLPTPAAQLAEQAAKVQQLRNSSERLRQSVISAVAKETLGAKAITNFATFFTPGFTSVLKGEAAPVVSQAGVPAPEGKQCYARLRMPKSLLADQSWPARSSMFLEPGDVERLHATLA